jgi:hypothetical protein
MFDPEAFLTELYVDAADFCKTQPPLPPAPGPAPALSVAEVITLSLFAQWRQFPSEAAFHRYAHTHLRPLFPTLPCRPQFNRQVRHTTEALTAFALHLGQHLATGDERGFEALDGTGLVTRNAQRRGRGWLAGLADIGWCTRLGWYEGMRLLLAVTPAGAITGWGFGSASTNDRVLAETFFAARARPQPTLPSVGQQTSDCYVADMGFSGREGEARWAQAYGATVICPPQSDSHRAWPKSRRRWLAGIRQVIETVTDHLLSTFGLDHERPHALDGLLARLAARVGLHNACCWFNRSHDRGLLAVADFLEW